MMQRQPPCAPAVQMATVRLITDTKWLTGVNPVKRERSEPDARRRVAWFPNIADPPERNALDQSIL
jgi:hypothetical protein